MFKIFVMLVVFMVVAPQNGDSWLFRAVRTTSAPGGVTAAPRLVNRIRNILRRTWPFVLWRNRRVRTTTAGSSATTVSTASTATTPTTASTMSTASTTASTATTTSATTTTTGSCNLADGAFATGMQIAHNTRRQAFNNGNVVSNATFVQATIPIPDLTWDSELAALAQAHSDKCQFAHSNGSSTTTFSSVGENLFSQTSSSCADQCTLPFTAEDVVKAWYDEIINIHQGEVCTFMSLLPGTTAASGGVTGHFTQVIWAGTTKIGCGVTLCTGCQYIVTCNYGAQGNIQLQPTYEFNTTDCFTANG